VLRDTTHGGLYYTIYNTDHQGPPKEVSLILRLNGKFSVRGHVIEHCVPRLYFVQSQQRQRAWSMAVPHRRPRRRQHRNTGD